MPKFIQCLLLFALIILSAACHSHDDKTYLENWKSYPITKNADTLKRYNSAIEKWNVFVKNDTIRVTDKKSEPEAVLPFELPGPRSKWSILKVDDGYLIGKYRGEWGGNLFWYSFDGKTHYEISKDEILQFVTRDGQIFAIQGLANGGMSEGSVISIKKKNGRWAAQEYLKLPVAPNAIALDKNNNFIIITSERILKVDTNAALSTLVNKIRWFSGIAPNSIIIKNDIVYMGMRAGVYTYDLPTGKEKWLLPVLPDTLNYTLYTPRYN